MKKAAIYVRVSIPDQHVESHLRSARVRSTAVSAFIGTSEQPFAIVPGRE
mgnify:CR=1 FL=1